MQYDATYAFILNYTLFTLTYKIVVHINLFQSY